MQHDQKQIGIFSVSKGLQLDFVSLRIEQGSKAALELNPNRGLSLKINFLVVSVLRKPFMTIRMSLIPDCSLGSSTAFTRVQYISPTELTIFIGHLIS